MKDNRQRAKVKTTYEYFCNACGQFRLAICHKPLYCSQCRSRDILIGKPGTLDKTKLKAAFNDHG